MSETGGEVKVSAEFQGMSEGNELEHILQLFEKRSGTAVRRLAPAPDVVPRSRETRRAYRLIPKRRQATALRKSLRLSIIPAR